MTAAPVIGLHAANLSVGYISPRSEHVLFRDLNLKLQPGKLTCFMGPNGIGKSTLIRVLAGLQKPLRGECDFSGADKIALVLTDKITAANMTVQDLVRYGRYPHVGPEINFSKLDDEIVARAINDVGIQALTEKKVDELSDGQVQLAMVARALAQETPILLLDEPTAHLDLNHRVEIMRLLQSLAREKNKAVLVATHELDLALQMADLIWLATAEKKIKIGIPEDLVLDGSFDEIFQFKGFDLKTGKIQHHPFRGKKLRLQGDGHEFLWTKNALEREGFVVVTDEAASEISTSATDGRLRWTWINSQFDTLEALLAHLKKS